MAEPFTLQLHITDACQLRCRHCYRDAAHAQLPLADLRRIVDQLTAFCVRYRRAGRVTFAGGEPLLRRDDLLALSRQARTAGHQVHVLTNGVLIDRRTGDALRDAGVLRVQVSIDGDESAHDELRGAGAYSHAAAALRCIVAAGMHATISMTMGRWNHQCLESVIALARSCPAKLFVSRFVPCGHGMAMADDTLDAREWHAVMRRCRRVMRDHRAGVAMRDPLYVPMLRRGRLNGCGECGVGGCAIGYFGLAVESDGKAYPCRRLPIVIGTMPAMTIEQVWNAPLMQALRDRDRLGGACGRCRWRWQCGGCRAIAHGATGDCLAEDPQCPWAEDSLLVRARMALGV
jgi:radical SAM protein with 4Fe4S-binding SPASM domain